jgi:diaminopimelate decarboxylase
MAKWRNGENGERVNHLTLSSVGSVLRLALSKGLIRAEDTALLFYDLSFLASRIKFLTSVFPGNSLHALAIKANPLAKIMEFVRGIAPNIGVEAASICEVHMGLKAGYRPDQVVFDSPVKTIPELEFAIKTGIHINIDNLFELDRVRKIILAGTSMPTGTIGLRINPQIGVGTIAGSSVAGEYSKFGVPFRYFQAELENAFLTCSWLTGVHLHVGSQGCPMSMLVDGIGVLYDFVMEMNQKRILRGMPSISVFDIGGGLPISYNTHTEPPSMEEYVAKIVERAPQLFNPGSFKPVTEYGRWTYTNSGWCASRVEYVKRDPTVNTAMIHVGADLFLRECLNPKDWQHEYSVFDREGRLKSGIDTLPYNIAGPLCFSGDIIAKNVILPKIEEGDFLVIHDTGGYTFSMWSRYNSRQTPRIIGYRGEQFEIIKERESLEGLAGFWE